MGEEEGLQERVLPWALVLPAAEEKDSWVCVGWKRGGAAAPLSLESTGVMRRERGSSQ